MSETHAKYDVAGRDTVSLDEIRSWSCTKPFHDPAYEPPTHEQIKALLKFASFTQVEAAKLIGVNYDEKRGGSNVIRRYIAAPGNDNQRQISYAAWRLLLIYAGVVSIDPGIDAAGVKESLRNF